jgi:lipid-A-disaccharide synthase
LARALKELGPGVSLFGMGGPAMREAGVDTIIDATGHGVVGFVEVLGRFGRIKRDYRTVVGTMRERRPDVLVAIDYGGFNAKLVARARREGVKTVYYIPPKVWAWKPGRGRRLARFLDIVLCIFPFEPEFWRERDVRAEFVGHPLLDTTVPSGRDVRAGRGITSNAPLVGLLPGSRVGEIDRLLPLMVRSAELIAAEVPEARFVLGLAPTVGREQVDTILGESRAPITVDEGSAVDLMAAADVLVAASGTVTLEAAILGTPMVIVYRVNPLTWEIGKRLASIKYMGLPNIIAGREIVPELLQNEARPELVAKAALKLLTDGAARAEQISELTRVKDALRYSGGDESATAAERAARYVVDVVADL